MRDLRTDQEVRVACIHVADHGSTPITTAFAKSIMIHIRLMRKLRNAIACDEAMLFDTGAEVGHNAMSLAIHAWVLEPSIGQLPFLTGP